MSCLSSIPNTWLIIIALIALVLLNKDSGAKPLVGQVGGLSNLAYLSN